MIRKASVLIILMLCNVLQAQEPFRGNKSIVKSEFIFQPGEVVFPSCHASTIAETSDGLIAAWFGGTKEGNRDVGIWISRYCKGVWSWPEEVMTGFRNGKLYPCWNPVLFNTGRELLLFYKIGPNPAEWWGELITSNDNGFTWSEKHILPGGNIGPVKNKPVMAGNGYLLCPSSLENDGWRIRMEMTPDFGFTWTHSNLLNDKSIDVIQPTVLIHDDGKIRILCRSRQSEIYTSLSYDPGKHWTQLKPTGLPNPNSGIDATALKDGRFFLVYNHLYRGRNMLNAAVSNDGVKWEAAVLLEEGAIGDEYSYPAVIQSRDGLIHITYTWKRKLIKHIVIDPLQIKSKPLISSQWPLE